MIYSWCVFHRKKTKQLQLQNMDVRASRITEGTCFKSIKIFNRIISFSKFPS
uniref:Uncharacterized protein n=1 Tax=Octopus bimaculoides TaxID=37653 RepID=A0A0L8HSF4_OCTBM